MSQLIQDGFTLEFVLPAAGPYEEIRGMYRPALAEAVYDYHKASTKADTGEKQMAANLKLLVGKGKTPLRHVLSWDIKEKDAAGVEKDVPVTEEHLRRLAQPRIEMLLDYVCGYRFADQEGDEKN